MPWIVDGNNLLGQIPGRSIGRSGDRRALASALAGLCESRRVSASLWFDGDPLEGWRATTWLGRLRVLHSGAGRSADDAILDEVARAKRAADVTVFTSDRSLADRCRGLGAAAGTTRKIRALLAEAERSRSGAPEKPERPESEEIERYLEIFGDGEGTKTP